jgi:hypothetical protein
MKYKVTGYAEVEVYIEVEADSPEDAIAKAFEQRSTLDFLAAGAVGIDEDMGESIDALGEINYKYAVEIDEVDKDDE